MWNYVFPIRQPKEMKKKVFTLFISISTCLKISLLLTIHGVYSTIQVNLSIDVCFFYPFLTIRLIYLDRSFYILIYSINYTDTKFSHKTINQHKSQFRYYTIQINELQSNELKLSVLYSHQSPILLFIESFVRPVEITVWQIRQECVNGESNVVYVYLPLTSVTSMQAT